MRKLRRVRLNAAGGGRGYFSAEGGHIYRRPRDAVVGECVRNTITTCGGVDYCLVVRTGASASRESEEDRVNI